jgi:hypothetical protein
LDKYKKEQDKLDMEANFNIDLEELNRQSNIGKSFDRNIKLKMNQSQKKIYFIE